jgi:hypothetical protein
VSQREVLPLGLFFWGALAAGGLVRGAMIIAAFGSTAVWNWQTERRFSECADRSLAIFCARSGARCGEINPAAGALSCCISN